jgi:type II secretory pathway pseudopilin PulG
VTRRARLAFTLIEMLVVVLFTGLVLTFAANFYLDISVASQAALERTVGLRRATSVLDRVSRDLESAVLLTKPEAVDPLDHPWVFLAESSGRGSGAERLKFQARNHRPRAALGHESDLVVIAYWVAPAEDGESLELLRWTSPQLPESLDRSFPRRDDPGVELLASRVAAFGVRLQDEAGSWSDSWDSSQLVHSGELPVAAEVSVALLPEEPPAEEALEAEPPVPYLRPVLLALRPLDLEKALGEESEGEPQEEKEQLACVTVSECMSRNQAAVGEFLTRQPEYGAILESMGDQCWSDHAASLPLAVTNCQE